MSAGSKQKATRDGKKEKQGKKTTDLAGAPIYGDLDLAKSRQQSHEQREQQ
jgi:hypothetical protein